VGSKSGACSVDEVIQGFGIFRRPRRHATAAKTTADKQERCRFRNRREFIASSRELPHGHAVRVGTQLDRCSSPAE
jgi:hypothetical protein